MPISGVSAPAFPYGVKMGLVPACQPLHYADLRGPGVCNIDQKHALTTYIANRFRLFVQASTANSFSVEPKKLGPETPSQTERRAHRTQNSKTRSPDSQVRPVVSSRNGLLEAPEAIQGHMFEGHLGSRLSLPLSLSLSLSPSLATLFSLSLYIYTNREIYMYTYIHICIPTGILHSLSTQMHIGLLALRP